jgi:hypothetical protein
MLVTVTKASKQLLLEQWQIVADNMGGKKIVVGKAAVGKFISDLLMKYDGCGMTMEEIYKVCDVHSIHLRGKLDTRLNQTFHLQIFFSITITTGNQGYRSFFHLAAIPFRHGQGGSTLFVHIGKS